MNQVAIMRTRKRGGQSFFSKWVYLTPALVLMLVFYIWPLLLTVYYAFTNLALTGSSVTNFKFVGLHNFTTMFNDRGFFTSVLNTLLFLVGSLIGQQFLGFTLAYFMRNSSLSVRRVVGIIILAAWIMPELVAALCAYNFFTIGGTLNAFLASLNIEPIAWLFDHPMMSIVLSNIWRGTAFSMMVYQSAMDSISKDVEESAVIDGVNKLQNITHIIIPLLKLTIWTNTLMNTLKTLGCFSMIYAMTGGGPGTATQTLSIFTYLRAFKNNKLGYACACSLILMFLGAIISILYVRSTRKDDL